MVPNKSKGRKEWCFLTVEIGEELLIGEKGNEESFEVLYTCKLKGIDYLIVALQKELDEEKEDLSIIAYRYKEEEDGTIVYDEMESDDEWNQVESQFLLYLEQIENDTYSG